MNSREKGKRGERLWRDFLRGYGFTARRGQQFSGSPDSPDVVCLEMEKSVHFEVKFVEKLNIASAMGQAKQDSGGKIPVLAHKKSREDWLVTMNASDWIRLMMWVQHNKLASLPETEKEETNERSIREQFEDGQEVLEFAK